MTSFDGQDFQQSNHPDLWTVRRILSWSAEYLSAKSKELRLTAKLDVELLLASVLGLDRMKLYLQLDRPLTRDERESFKLYLRRRVDFEPVAYILGYKDFYRHRFKVTPDVLIPRPETEILVEAVALSLKDCATPTILDVGTGSGCIAISLAAELPNASVIGWDISSEAIKIARENSDMLEIPNVTFAIQDAKVGLHSSEFEVDVIVSNPPYVSRGDTGVMSQGVLLYEPELALFTRDQLGLEFYEVFATSYKALLGPGGKIFLEIGFSQGEKVAHLFEAAGWGKIKVLKDLSGHDRVVAAEKTED